MVDSRNSGEVEWYTPEDYIEAARLVMDDIDLDPASNETINKIVRATTFYDEEGEGLEKAWHGHVWLNLPYDSVLTSLLCKKLVSSMVGCGDVFEAILLVNSCTFAAETEWGQSVLEASNAVCFPSDRVKFLRPDGTFEAPLPGQMFVHFGSFPDRFAHIFSEFGVVFG